MPRYTAHISSSKIHNEKKCCGTDRESVLIGKEDQDSSNRGGSKENHKPKCENEKQTIESKYTQDKNERTDNRFVLIKGGDFWIGTDKPFIPQDGESPARKVYLDDFHINEFEVSNEEFSLFVQESKYTTEVNINSGLFCLITQYPWNCLTFI